MRDIPLNELTPPTISLTHFDHVHRFLVNFKLFTTSNKDKMEEAML